MLAPLPAVAIAGDDPAPRRERLVGGHDQRSLAGDGGEDALAHGQQWVWVGVGRSPIGMVDFAGVVDDVAKDVADLTCRLETHHTMPGRLTWRRDDCHPWQDLLLIVNELHQSELVDNL